jgi:hypothetical protein
MLLLFVIIYKGFVEQEQFQLAFQNEWTRVTEEQWKLNKQKEMMQEMYSNSWVSSSPVHHSYIPPTVQEQRTALSHTFNSSIPTVQQLPLLLHSQSSPMIQTQPQFVSSSHSQPYSYISQFPQYTTIPSSTVTTPTYAHLQLNTQYQSHNNIPPTHHTHCSSCKCTK